MVALATAAKAWRAIFALDTPPGWSTLNVPQAAPSTAKYTSPHCHHRVLDSKRPQPLPPFHTDKETSTMVRRLLSFARSSRRQPGALRFRWLVGWLAEAGTTGAGNTNNIPFCLALCHLTCLSCATWSLTAQHSAPHTRSHSKNSHG